MAKITSKASLNVGTEIVIDEGAKTIQLVQAGNLRLEPFCCLASLRCNRLI